MDDVIRIATSLAEAIAKSGRYTALRKAEKAVESEAEAKALLDDFNKKTMAVLEKEQAMKPVEPEEKREIVALKEKIASNPALQDLSKAQVEYSEMMNKVNQVLFERLDVKPG